MRIASRVAALLRGLVLVGCVPAEVPPEVGLPPVVAREGFALPSAAGHQPLPSAFLGIVVTPHQIESFSAPGGPRTLILDDARGLAARSIGMIDELFDPLARALEAEEPIDVVWFIDARVQGRVVASVLYTASRSRLQAPLWLATGSATAPTRVGVSPFSFREPPRGPEATRFEADLELYMGPVSTTAVAVPRAKGDAPNESTLAASIPHERPLELTAAGSCRYSDAALHEVGAALCEIQRQPFGLRWIVDVDTSYPRLLERLVDDPRPARCVGGSLMVRFSEDNPPSCQAAVLLRDLLPHFAYEARQQRERPGESQGEPLDRP